MYFLESLASKKSAIQERIDSLYKRLQYQAWFIKISTVKRRILLSLAVSLFGAVFVLIVVCANHDGHQYDCQNMLRKGADYRGNTDRTKSGLECVAWDTLDRNTHTVTIDRCVPQDSFF